LLKIRFLGAITLSPQYITDSKGNRVSVVLSVAEFQQLLELLEELEDVRLYDEVKSRNEERVSLKTT
jgi:hypothetical protein